MKTTICKISVNRVWVLVAARPENKFSGEQPIHTIVGYRIRIGKHDVTEYDGSNGRTPRISVLIR